MVDCWQYIFHLTEKERLRIRREDDLQEFRTPIGVVVGILTAVGVFLLQLPWAGEPHVIHGYASYGAIPAGFLAGAWVRHWLPHYVHRRWMTVWHPIVKARRDAEGWVTLTPPRPPTFLELLDRRYIGLDQSGCNLLTMAGGYLLLLIIQPAAATTSLGFWAWLIVMMTWFPVGLLVAERFYECLSPQAPGRGAHRRPC